jgi:histone deacetylase 6
MPEEFNGFCFLNNVAIAAKRALDVHKLQRVLVIDWDVHHGQGIQRAFYESSKYANFRI